MSECRLQITKYAEFPRFLHRKIPPLIVRCRASEGRYFAFREHSPLFKLRSPASGDDEKGHAGRFQASLFLLHY